MADYSEKDVENARHVEDVTKSPESGLSIGVSSGQLQTLEKPGLPFENAMIELSEAERKRIIRKVDWRLVPLLTFLYLVAFIDRSNSKSLCLEHGISRADLSASVGNAKIAGLNDDLGLHGLQYNAAVTLFYVPYTLLEVPSNIILKLMRPSLWIAILLFSWGLVMTLMGLVHSYAGLLVARWFLGVAEAGFFPAATFLLTIWYKRYEYQQRFAIFYSMASMAGAFSGLLAFAIEKMDGVGGRSGWQWVCSQTVIRFLSLTDRLGDLHSRRFGARCILFHSVEDLAGLARDRKLPGGA
jgi:MFS family permease